MPVTPLRAVRVADDLWNRLKARAKSEGTTVSDVIRRACERYLKT